MVANANCDSSLSVHFFPQPVDFQVVLIGNREKTYVIYTYFCPSGLSSSHPDFIPHPISGTVGVSIKDLFDREFRYSNTNYAVEMRCINQMIDSDYDYSWYNLYYDLVNSGMEFSELNNSEIPSIISEFLIIQFSKVQTVFVCSCYIHISSICKVFV